MSVKSACATIVIFGAFAVATDEKGGVNIGCTSCSIFGLLWRKPVSRSRSSNRDFHFRETSTYLTGTRPYSRDEPRDYGRNHAAEGSTSSSEHKIVPPSPSTYYSVPSTPAFSNLPPSPYVPPSPGIVPRSPGLVPPSPAFPKRYHQVPPSPNFVDPTEDELKKYKVEVKVETDMDVSWLVSLGWMTEWGYEHQCTGVLIDIGAELLRRKVVLTTNPCAKRIKDQRKITRTYAIFKDGRLIEIATAQTYMVPIAKTESRRTIVFGLVLLSEPVKHKAISFPKEVAEIMETSGHGTTEEVGITLEESHVITLFEVDWVMVPTRSEKGLDGYSYKIRLQKVTTTECDPGKETPGSNLVRRATLCVTGRPTTEDKSGEPSMGSPCIFPTAKVSTLLGLFTKSNNFFDVYHNILFNGGDIASIIRRMGTLANRLNQQYQQ